MWDSNTPLQLLKTMPNVLEKEHLEKLQKLLDADKYKNQLVSGVDVCGTYAPFCYGCYKENEFPCAVAYVNYLKEQGADIELASDTVAHNEEEAAETLEEQSPAVEEAEEESVEDTEEAQPAEDSKPEEKAEKTKIRIAVARKKLL